MGHWGLEHAGVWGEMREMTEDYKNSYLYGRLRERWGSMSADKRAEAIRRLVEVRVNPAGRGTKIFDPSKVEFTWK